MSHFYDRINTIYKFINHFMDTKMSIFEEYGAFKLLMTDLHLQNRMVLYKLGHSIFFKTACATSKNSDPSAHPRSLISFHRALFG